ncbi:uncharacterized protein K441DRAFT_552179, partial [Cenococcum geophilum 1.58]|uniref:uncharacterized protein n=1 Tax=Cenococcum geophilum 1.58 TaxID=794803 RepID=UPI00358E9C37
ERYKQKIRSQGYHSINAVKGTKLYNCYNKARRKLYSIINVLRKQKEDQVILNFYNAIDDYNIKRQLSGSVRTDIPTRLAI